METVCLLCEKRNATDDLYGYAICHSCKAKLGLLTDQTITKHILRFERSSKELSYQEEVRNRLTSIQKGYIKTEIKLLHILERLEKMGSFN